MDCFLKHTKDCVQHVSSVKLSRRSPVSTFSSPMRLLFLEGEIVIQQTDGGLCRRLEGKKVIIGSMLKLVE